MVEDADGTRDFFISFNQADRVWATWIAWTLEEAGYSVFFQDWDFTGNFILEMDRAHTHSRRTIAVVSPDFLASRFTAPEWAARFAEDAASDHDLLIPVRIRPCELGGLLAQLVYVDLLGCGESEARERLLNRVAGIRLKPEEPPLFPAASGHPVVPEQPTFPVAAGQSQRPPLTRSTFLSWFGQQPRMLVPIIADTRAFFATDDVFRREGLAAALGYFLFLNVLLVVLSIPTEQAAFARAPLAIETIGQTLAQNVFTTIVFALCLKLAMLTVRRQVDISIALIMSCYIFTFFLATRLAFYITVGLIRGYIDAPIAELMSGGVPFCAMESMPLWALALLPIVVGTATAWVLWKTAVAFHARFRLGMWRSGLATILASSAMYLIGYLAMMPMEYATGSGVNEPAGSAGAGTRTPATALEQEPNDQAAEATRIESGGTYEGRIRKGDIDLFDLGGSSVAGVPLHVKVEKVSGFGCVRAGLYDGNRQWIADRLGYEGVDWHTGVLARGVRYILLTTTEAAKEDEYWRYELSIRED